MTAADIAALIGALSAPVAGAFGFVMRWSSQAGRAIREQQGELDDWIRYGYTLRRVAARHGIEDLPEPPADRPDKGLG